MIVRAYEGKQPRLGARVFIAENAAVIGDVDLGDDCSIWYSSVVRGDVNSIRIGARTNIQDNCTVHVENEVDSRCQRIAQLHRRKLDIDCRIAFRCNAFHFP